MRHAGDLVRAVAGSVLFGLTLAFIHRGHVGTIETNVFRLVNELPSWINIPLVVVMQGGTIVAVAVVSLAALLIRRPRLARDVAVGGTAAWFVAKLAKEIVRRARPEALLRFTTIRGATATGLGLPSGHAAGIAALVTAAGPHLTRRQRRLSWLLVAGVALARMYVGAHLPLDVVGGAAIGWVIGAAIHLVFGAPGGSPTVSGVQSSLKRMGISIKNIRLLNGDARGSTPMLAQDSEGNGLFLKWKGRQHRDADWLFRAWRYLMYRHIGDEIPFATPKQL
jgi:membrane-associated phospholipid phosphatase